MGAGASANVKVEELNPALDKFMSIFQPLSVKGKGARGARVAAWRSCDNNGNGMCSLAECDGWIQKMLQAEFAEGDDYLVIWKRYRPSYIRAFNDANDVAGEKGLKGSTTTTTDSYVTKTEFRLFCAYLCIYACMYEAFTMLDGTVPETTDDIAVGSADDDRRIEQAEFTANFETIKGKFGFQAVADCAEEVGDGKVFAKIDADGKGKVLLKEWCEWIEKAEIAAGTEAGNQLGAGDD